MSLPRIKNKKAKVGKPLDLPISITSALREGRKVAMKTFQLLGSKNPVRYWIGGRLKDEKYLMDMGIELGPILENANKKILDAHGLCVWSQCKVPDFNKLDQHWGQFVWGPDKKGGDDDNG